MMLRHNIMAVLIYIYLLIDFVSKEKEGGQNVNKTRYIIYDRPHRAKNSFSTPGKNMAPGKVTKHVKLSPS